MRRAPEMRQTAALLVSLVNANPGASKLAPAAGLEPAAPRLDSPPDARRTAAWLLSAAVLCLSLARFACLVDHSPCAMAHGERNWFAWSYRHSDPEDLFQRIGSQLRPAEPIVIVGRQAAGETYWWRGMASYFLGDHPVAAVENRGQRPRVVGPGQALVMISAGGIRVVRAPA